MCGQFLGHSLFNRALRTLGASTVAVVTLLEVPGAATPRAVLTISGDLHRVGPGDPRLVTVEVTVEVT